MAIPWHQGGDSLAAVRLQKVPQATWKHGEIQLVPPQPHHMIPVVEHDADSV